MSLTAYIDTAWSALIEGVTEGATTERIVGDADAARDRKDWPLAAQLYAEAISSGYASGGVKVQLGHALKEMGKFDSAEELYRQFLHDNPGDPDIHLQLGHLFNKKSDFAGALTFYESAHQLAPQDREVATHASMARRNLGRSDIVRKRDATMALVSNKKWEEARVLLRTLVAVDGEKDLIGVFANVTKEAGRLDEAAALYDCYFRYATSTGDSKLIADCHMQLGHLHKIKGQTPASLNHFMAARKIERSIGQNDLDELEVEREIVACLREIYPCFVFRD